MFMDTIWCLNTFGITLQTLTQYMSLLCEKPSIMFNTFQTCLQLSRYKNLTVVKLINMLYHLN